MDSTNPCVVKEFASGLRAYSSTYGRENSMSYGVQNILHQPSIYPNYGDFTQACVFRTYGLAWKKGPDAARPFSDEGSRFTSDDYVELQYHTKIYISAVTVYETYNPGAVSRILAYNPDAEHPKSRWFVLWEVENGRMVKIPELSRKFSPHLATIPFPTNIIRLEFKHDCLAYYTELDAVELTGSTDVCVDVLTGPPSYSVICPPPPDYFSLPDLGSLTLSLPEETERQLSIPSDNGLFDILPIEVLHSIVNLLTLEELGKLAQVSQFFANFTYSDSLRHYHRINLQPYWYRLDSNGALGLAKRCSQTVELNLSWCGRHMGLTGSNAVCLLHPSLEVLRLSACDFTDEDFRQIMQRCTELPHLRELDLSSNSTTLTPQTIALVSKMPNITRLNLYRTRADTYGMVNIATNCCKLEHLNIGAICDLGYNEVCAALGRHCFSLKSLDMWRAVDLSDVGINFLVQGCQQLESLDIGWCTSVHMGGSSVPVIATSCPKLRKIFLTANRSVTDADMLALAEHCPLLEQVDILGNNSVTGKTANTLLARCPRLSFFDLSFCNRLTEDVHVELRRRYPHCDIKRSFQ